MKADRELTAAKNFKHPKSYVAPDGREVLYGKDWSTRKLELLERAHGRCEWITRDTVRRHEGSSLVTMEIPVRCKSEAHHPHHIIRRSVKRDDRLPNLKALCVLHHDLLDERKPRWSKKAQP
jgi:hypothetical protein